MRQRPTELENASRGADVKSQRRSSDVEHRTDARAQVGQSTHLSCSQVLDQVHRVRSQIHPRVRPIYLCRMQFLCRMHRQAPRIIFLHPSVRPAKAREKTLRSMRCHLVLVEGGRSVRPMALTLCEAMTAKRRLPRKPGSALTCHRVRLRVTTASTATTKVDTRRRRRHRRLRTQSTVMTGTSSSGATSDQELGLERSSGHSGYRLPRGEDHAAQTYIGVLCATH